MRQTVNLSIYNSLGQRVKTLINSELQAGSYKLYWDGYNDNNKLVGSGIYLYKIETDKFILSRKMLLLK